MKIRNIPTEELCLRLKAVMASAGLEMPIETEKKVVKAFAPGPCGERPNAIMMPTCMNKEICPAPNVAELGVMFSPFYFPPEFRDGKWLTWDVSYECEADARCYELIQQIEQDPEIIRDHWNTLKK